MKLCISLVNERGRIDTSAIGTRHSMTSIFMYSSVKVSRNHCFLWLCFDIAATFLGFSAAILASHISIIRLMLPL